MSCFPFFRELKGTRGLIIGGGAVALRKTKKLLPFGPELTVAAPAICEELRALEGVRCLDRPFGPELLEGMDFVIAAADRHEVNAEAARLCRERSIPVNVADDPEAGTFLFPALVRRGDLTVGISTGGGSPTAAIYLKEQIDDLLPQSFGEILENLHRQRDRIKATVPEEGQRRRILKALFLACLEAQRPLTAEETEEIINHETKNGGYL